MKEKNNTKKDKSYLAMIIPYILRFKRRVIISLLLIVVGRLLSVANPYIIKELVDSLAESSNTDIDIMYLVYLIIFFFLFRW
jgi:ABC-type multidrug transport system fused ATPase/permease subunit